MFFVFIIKGFCAEKKSSYITWYKVTFDKSKCLKQKCGGKFIGMLSKQSLFFQIHKFECDVSIFRSVPMLVERSTCGKLSFLDFVVTIILI